jgi:2-keto-3-deoxy-L-rhamnonate aldolase RhmA
MHPALESAWAEGRPAYASWVTIDSDTVVRAVEQTGYDCVGLDCQHGEISEQEAARLLRRMHGFRCATVVRVSENSAAAIGRVLDAGADAVIVPMVNNADEARKAVAACRYAPAGVRSFGPSRLGMPRLPKELEDRAACFVMIESSDGLDNAESICAVPGVAGVVIGPADLSIALGLDPAKAFTTDQIHPAVDVIRAACEHNEIVLGFFAAGGQSAAEWAERGCRLIVVGGVLNALTKTLAAELSIARGTTR